MPLASPSTTHHADPPSNRTGLAVAALVFGVLTAGVALMVAFVGVFLPYAWYAVVGLAVLTLVCGTLSIGRRHHNSAAGGVMAWVGVMGGVVALVLGVWGVTNVLRADHHGSSAAATGPLLHPSPVPGQAAAPTTTPLAGTVIPVGQSYTVDNVEVKLDGPVPYQPAGMVQTNDGSTVVRTVEFLVTLTNRTTSSLIANGVDVQGIVGGATIGKVYDDTVHALEQDIHPGQTVSFPIAFNLPAAPTPMLVEVDPQSMNSTNKVYFQGTV